MRSRWPVTYTDELVRHVARQLPELNRRQVMAVLNTTMVAIRESLVEQARQGAESPSVTIRSAGAFELRWYKSVRRHHLNGTMRTVPPRWKVVFRPAKGWLDAAAAASRETRTTLQGAPLENPCLELPECELLPRGDEAVKDFLSHLQSASDAPDRGGERPDGAGAPGEAEGGS